MLVCTVEACDHPAKSHDLCNSHNEWRRKHGGQRPTHVLRHRSTSAEESLAYWSEFDPATGCRLWQANTSKGGYPSMTTNGRVQAAYRVAYELKHGPIPKGMEIDHLCQRIACVEPDHMEVVTKGENLKRQMADGHPRWRNR